MNSKLPENLLMLPRAAKTAAQKSTKSALAKAKKAEKVLADADQGRIQRVQAVTERLNKILALAGGKYHTFSLLH
jgi:hypothetical protein